MHAGKFYLLKTRRFFPFFLTQFLQAFNDNIFKNAIAILITYKMAIGSPGRAQLLINLAAAVYILPFFLFSAIAGQLADKFGKAILIRIIKFFEIIFMSIGAVGFYTNNISLLMIALFLIGTHSAFFSPIKYSILPDQLHENELIAGNAYIEASTFCAILIGTILGGVLIIVSKGEVLTSSILMMTALAGWISSFFIPQTRPAQPLLNVNFNIFSETLRILEYSMQKPDIFICILGISWFWLVGATLVAQFPTLAKDVMNANSQVVTLFLSLFSIGVAVGSLACNRLLKNEVNPKYVPLGVLGITVFLIDLYFSCGHVMLSNTSPLIGAAAFLLHPQYWHVLFDIFMLSVCGGIYIVPLYAIMQMRSEPEHRSRMIASNNIMNSVAMVGAAVATSLLFLLHFSILQIILMLAIGNTIVAVYICKLLPHILLQAFTRWLLKLCYRVNITGMEHYHNTGKRVIIVANHTSFLDIALLASFFPDKFVLAVNTQIAREWWMQPLLSLVDAFRIESVNPMSTKSLIKEIKEDKKCIIFPEGRLSVTGSLMKVYEGTGLIADKSGAIILPVRIEGAQYSFFTRLKGKVKRQLFPKISVTIFPPRYLDVPDEMKGRARRRFLSERLYDIMTNMIFDSSDYQRSLFDSLLEARKTHGGRHIILEDIEHNPINYNQLIARSFILGKYLNKSIKEDVCVGVMLPNMVSTLVVFFALQAHHRVPAILNFSSGPLNILSACQMAQIKTVYTSRRFIEAAKLESVIAQLLGVGITIAYLEDLRAEISFLSKLTGLLIGRFSSRQYYQKISPKHSDTDPAVILFTSGSEGIPKGVVLSHRNVQANRCQLASVVDFNIKDVVLNALPIFHTFGLTAGTLMPLFLGVKTILYPSPLHYRIIPELIYEFKATITFGTDTFLAGYGRYANPYDFYNIRYVFSGAEKLKEETRNLWSEKFGVRILEGYGTTETSPVLSTNTAMHNRTGTVGRFLPGIEYKLEPVPGVSEGGCLHVTGPNIMLGYLRAGQPGVLQPPEGGWYNTGDVVVVDAEGFIKIKDRVKRFAKVGGEMISLTGVEHYLSELWPGHRHAVVSTPNPRKGEQLMLITDYKEASRDMIVAFVKSKGIAVLSIPRHILILDKVPLLSSGKVDYQKLKEITALNREKHA